ncbi:hypothetical protein CLIM01_10518 [Colletotrichum limetticola]|uniref:Uncharacterized protein n=1 Tax=Colletotrichum limetticola TaxID=1209924 RepID=A0ABQ9PJB8_9PEZI|nr:hypothetical protein CLIM01_10518 [Colletotrichum limetticola]
MPYTAVTDTQKLFPLPLASWHRGTSFKMLSLDAPGREASGARHGWTQCKEIPGRCQWSAALASSKELQGNWLMVQLRGMAVWDAMGGHPLARLGFREIDELT